ncbi:SDR family oxidoreductase [Mycolicibacterium sp. P9-64]|uniref:SDR family NAD(P)-dependent oxidoreductase n=1 Tax=Mycolicibacterium sp. P9-64 TaxID=2024612 RepID=UPI0011EC5C56|nr:SDR family oxidoreductase [Mycolicibacterium sp. P9-64]KAA0082659.1 SDR family oxidoreductase [Mycolicibacterium sp. P9-64]
MGRLDNKYAVITGATGGVGRAACRMFCAEGASVIGVDISTAAGADLERELKGEGYDFQFRTVDVSSEEQVNDLAAEITGDRPIDIVYNNAGTILGKHILESSVEEWDRVHDVNSKSVFLMIRAFAPRMTNPGGSIVNTSSGGGVVAIPNMSVYGAAKAGVILLSRAAAVDLAPGIRVNALVPGLIDTAMPQSFVSELPEEHRAAVLDGMKAQHLTRRLGRPEEVAAAALFLASDEASFVTASALVVDGGATAM